MSKSSSTIKEEVIIGRRYSPEIAWRTIFLAIGVYAGLTISIWAALNGHLTYWVAGVINCIILYGTYTVIHEAVHNNIVPRNRRLRWVNSFFGFAICLIFWMFYYPHKKAHIVHHNKCNTDEDPDIYARGAFGVVTFWNIPLVVLSSFNPFTIYKECTKYNLKPRERYITMLTFLGYSLIAAGLVYAGYGLELLVLWFMPWFVGNSVMLIFFTWMPHHPHFETTRYRDTRCSIWPFANFLTQGQHMHLIHHMMPWVPYYQYEKVFYEIRPYLEQNDAMIDGFLPKVRQVNPDASGASGD